MNKLPLSFALATLVVAVPAITPAQFIPATRLVEPAVIGDAAVPTPPSNATTPGKAVAASSDSKPSASPRLAKLKAIKFDRRPSSILKAWAPPSGTGQPTPADPKAAALAGEIAAFEKAVTLGDWPAVKAYLASLPDEEATAAYSHLLQNLRQRPGIPMPTPAEGNAMSPVELQMMQAALNSPIQQQYGERNTFTADDVVGLAAAAPTGPNPALFPIRSAVVGAAPVVSQAPVGLMPDHLTSLAAILRAAITGGTLTEVAVARIEADAINAGGESAFSHREAATLLILANLAEYAGTFLPTPEQAVRDRDLEALNLLSRHFLALNAKESESGNLERAWAAIQAVLAVPDGIASEKNEALLRAVELAPRLDEELGQDWLAANFTENPDRGMEILAAVGTLVAQGLAQRPHATDQRLNALALMKTAVEALLKAAPDRAKAWGPTLTLLAAGWQTEADFSRRFDQSAGSGPSLQRDMYGNIFFGSSDIDSTTQMMMRSPNQPRPVPVADVLKAAPSPEWVAAVDDSLRPKLAGTVARLHLKANDEKQAFPLIQQLADTQPAEAKELVKEFIRVWTRTHDPNSARNENRYSWYFFATEQRAESIPLTRSKQERNLKELAAWAEKIRALPSDVGDLDDAIMVKAFTVCHSSAEVYRTEAIEAVFGPMGGLKPRTLAGLADQMRTNLATLWKDPKTQQQSKTNRRKKDIEAEVLRGYAVACGVVADGLAKFPDHWALLAAAAGLAHDEVNYRQELNTSAKFSAKRRAALAMYQDAATAYAQAVRELPADEQTADVYESWFAASLGAVDLGMITESKQPDWTQPPLIRAALLALPGELAEEHMAKFANNLFIKMSGAKPHVKYNYLKAGFQVVGDHDRAAEAKKVFDYYNDLVTEIKLDAVVDGSTRIGHDRPFGLFVNLRHTRDIERESGGFGRYLQNQNSMTYSYNYGRPTADYRDRFETAARDALKEQFEVISVTFQDEKVTSRADPDEFGWRYTPYAYVLMKPRGPQVDKIPPLRIDLDFLDTSGYMVMPVESPAVPIDARDAVGDARPVEDLTVTQILDERQADKGTLLLEVKAVGVGLVPDWDELVGSFAPAGFEVTETEDLGLGVKKFAEDAEANAVVSERSWLLTLTGATGQATLPTTFTFAPVQVPTNEIVYQRYDDADLASVGDQVSLERTYAQASTAWVLYAVAGLAVVLAVVIGLVVFLAARTRPAPAMDGLPSDMSPFVAAGLLREIRERADLTPDQRTAIDRDIAAVEDHYFAAENSGEPPPDVRGLVDRWATHLPPRTTGS